MCSPQYSYYDTFIEILIEKELLLKQEKFDIELIEEIINNIFLNKT